MDEITFLNELLNAITESHRIFKEKKDETSKIEICFTYEAAMIALSEVVTARINNVGEK